MKEFKVIKNKKVDKEDILTDKILELQDTIFKVCNNNYCLDNAIDRMNECLFWAIKSIYEGEN